MSNTSSKKFVNGYCRIQPKMEMAFDYTWEFPNFRKTYNKILPQETVIEDQPFKFILKLFGTEFDINIYSTIAYKSICSLYLSDTCIFKDKELSLPSNEIFFLFTEKINFVMEHCRIDGSLTINFNCECYNSISKTTMHTAICYEMAEENNNMILDEKSLVIFVIGDKRLYANKNLICKNSYFKAMFDHDTTESKTNEVQITDDKYDIFKMLLTYIQAPVKPNFDDMNTETLIELLVIADKYAEEDLKLFCECRLIKLIDTKNCKKFYNEEWLDITKYLKKYVQQFIEIRLNTFDLKLTSFVETGDESLLRDTSPERKRFKYNVISYDTKIDKNCL